MKKFSIWLLLIVVAAAVLFTLVFFKCSSDWCFVSDWQKVKHTNDFASCEKRGFTILETYPRVCKAGDKTFVEDSAPQPFVSDNVIVTQPLPNTVVKSPIYIKGDAKNWYFEASFPVSVVDANGQVLGGGIATAQGDWMTSSFVPFTSTITFKTPTTPTGFIIFTKDNPSGLPEHDDEERMPIKFQ